MILFTPPLIIPNEHHRIHHFFKNGLKTLHVRKPDFSKEEFIEYIEQIDKKFHPNLMIHQYPELVKQFDLKGISFTEKTKGRYDEFKNLAKVKSWSVHGIGELKEVPEGVDYVFLSPVFPSISKQGYERRWKLEEFADYLKNRKEKRFDLIALGGISSENFKTALDLGFDDVAMLGSVWENAEFEINDIKNLMIDLPTKH